MISIFSFFKKYKTSTESTSTHGTTTSTLHHYPVSEYPPYDMTEKDWPPICFSGREQTPIDVPAKNSILVTQSYGEVIKLLSSEYTVINGRDFTNHGNLKWVMDLTGIGSLYVMKNNITYKYDMANIHMHIYSEHTFKGALADMEFHIVHMKDTAWLKAQGVTDDPDKRNAALVLGTMWKAQGDVDHPDIAKLNWATGAPVAGLDFTSWANKTRNFWHYQGGLTTPGCNEFVNWVLYDGYNYMSVSQFESLKSQVMAVYPMGNGRTTKPLYNRKLFYVNMEPVPTAGGYYGMKSGYLVLISILIMFYLY
jgi:carbonic anhydrase